VVHDSLRNLRLDRRLLNRRDWLSPEELQREFSALPDVSDKIAPPEPELEEQASAPPTAEREG
jgi:hypothetical protein